MNFMFRIEISHASYRSPMNIDKCVRISRDMCKTSCARCYMTREGALWKSLNRAAESFRPSMVLKGVTRDTKQAERGSVSIDFRVGKATSCGGHVNHNCVALRAQFPI